MIKIIFPILIAILVGFPLNTSAQGDDDFVYGWEIMSKQERAEHRQALRKLVTKEEREAFRKEHHERMKERAKEMGVKLADEPGSMMKGMNPCSGMGMGGKGSGGMRR